MVDYRDENWLPASELPEGPLWFQKIQPFVSDEPGERARANFICPRAPQSQRGFTRDTLSYGWNERFLPFGTLSNKVFNPGETIVIADSLPSPQADTVLPPDADRPRLAARHREKANVLFLEGNAEAMSPAEAEFQWPRYWDRE
jgi:hypothetical protein